MNTDLREAAASLHHSLAECPWLRAVGIGQVGDAEGLIVYVNQNNPQIQQNIPDTWEKFQVSVMNMSWPMPAEAPENASNQLQTTEEMTDQDTPENKLEKPGLLSAVKTVGAAAAGAALTTVDWFHRFALRTRSGEKAVARTTRIRFSNEQRMRISVRQGHRCMYCGVTLSRNNRQIDHIYPVEFGGANAEANLQALCGACNARKGVQTDNDFRQRYRQALASVPVGTPPPARIPQQQFQAITRSTQQGAETRQLRKAIFRTPAQKISASSATASAIIGGAWFFAMPLLFGEHHVVGYIALYGGITVFVTGFAGSLWRARVTGIMEQS